MDESLTREEVMERFWKIGRIVLILAVLAGLIALGPAIKNVVVNLFFKALQSDIQITTTTIEEWAREDAVIIFTEELQDFGFQEIGDYAVSMSNRIKMRAFMNSKNNIYVTIYDNYGKAALMDFYTFYEDGTSVRMTTAPNPHEAKPEGKLIWYIEDPMSIGELLDKMLKNRPDKPILPVSKEGFMPALEKYMEEMSLWDSKQFMQ